MLLFWCSCCSSPIRYTGYVWEYLVNNQVINDETQVYAKQTFNSVGAAPAVERILKVYYYPFTLVFPNSTSVDCSLVFRQLASYSVFRHRLCCNVDQ